MSLADELSRLEQLRASGVLSDAEFELAKARALAAGPLAPRPAEAFAAVNGFRRTAGDRWLGGVCGGLARSTGLASWIWRLIFALLLLFGGSGLLLYVLLWIFVPSD